MKILHFFCRFNKEIRLVSSATSIQIEGIKDDATAFADFTIDKRFFSFWDPSSPVDLRIRSDSMRLVFRSTRLLKNLNQYDIWLQNNQSHGYFRQTCDSYRRLTVIPITANFSIDKLRFGDFESYPVHLMCYVELLSQNLRYFPNSVQLVTFRVRQRAIHVETGDEEEFSEFMTRFDFFDDEFRTYRRMSDVTCTFSIKAIKQFLSAFDKREQLIDCFLTESSGLVFRCILPNMTVRLLMSRVHKIHAPDPIPMVPVDESINVTYYSENNNGTPSRRESYANQSKQMSVPTQVIHPSIRQSFMDPIDSDISSIATASSFRPDSVVGPRASTMDDMVHQREYAMQSKDTGADEFEEDGLDEDLSQIDIQDEVGNQMHVNGNQSLGLTSINMTHSETPQLLSVPSGDALAPATEVSLLNPNICANLSPTRLDLHRQVLGYGSVTGLSQKDKLLQRLTQYQDSDDESFDAEDDDEGYVFM